MRDYITEYRLCGIRVSRKIYRAIGRFVPERLRDVRSA